MIFSRYRILLRIIILWSNIKFTNKYITHIFLNHNFSTVEFFVFVYDIIKKLANAT